MKTLLFITALIFNIALCFAPANSPEPEVFKAAQAEPSQNMTVEVYEESMEDLELKGISYSEYLRRKVR